MAVLGQLAGGIAHDFNNLLAALTGRTQDDKLKGWAERGLKAAYRGEKLVQQILLFARRQSLGPDLIDVENFVDELVDMLRLMASSLRVKTQIADNLWPLRADQDQLMLSIVNIAINRQRCDAQRRRPDDSRAKHGFAERPRRRRPNRRLPVILEARLAPDVPKSDG
jgi:C4-dicarboxylate-specific signal transduction histidine kinase